MEKPRFSLSRASMPNLALHRAKAETPIYWRFSPYPERPVQNGLSRRKSSAPSVASHDRAISGTRSSPGSRPRSTGTASTPGSSRPRSSRDDGGAIRVRVPNALFRDWLTKHYSGRPRRGAGRGRPAGHRGRLRHRRRTSPALAAAPLAADPAADVESDDRATTTAEPAAWPRATPSTPSSSGRRTSSRTPPAARSRRRRRAPTTRCSSTAASASARRT